MKHRLKSGRILTAEEWQRWRIDGLSTPKIAEILNITPSAVRYIARDFRSAGYIDPQYQKRKPGKSIQIDTTTDKGAYILGILWGTMSVAEENIYWVRHRDLWFIEIIRDCLKISSEGHKSYSSTGDQFRLKISRQSDIDTITQMLTPQGWTMRQAQERPYPSNSLNDKGFIRAWVELHNSVDIRQAKHRNGNYYPQKRLRIYGNWLLLEEINNILSSVAGLQLRTLQKTTNEITKGLYYQGKNVLPVVNWLYDKAEIWNPVIRRKLEFLD